MILDSQHWLLLFYWVLYCTFHSLLAGQSVKKKIEKIMGKGYKYYRLIYSVFASLSLGFLLWYQFTIVSAFLYYSKIVRFAGIIFCVPGIYIMAICIRKYFYELSGVQALQTDEPIIHLQETGLHRYVRHPLYSGTLLFVWGLFVIFPTMANVIACTVMTVYVLVGIKLEEKKLFIEFGDNYKNYSARVPMLIPKF